MDQANKDHRPAKVKKKFTGKNPKAFAVSNPGKLDRQAKRASEKNERRYHVPLVDRTPEDPPPVIVAVVGPSGCGKTTLIKSLVKRYSKQTLTKMRGPITVVSGKRQRLTFIECNNDMNSMIDIAKVADLILLVIDGNFGFEMETMEFLNILAPHGLPKILGILTHLDLFKSQSTLRATKKRLKTRFWTEIYQGAKLFYLSGVISGRYPDREILNLSRFISVMKFRPLVWRNTHSYLLSDRIVDLTHPSLIEQNGNVDRKICLYGYLHGTNLSINNARAHIPGVGDVTISEVSDLPDPCPTPMLQKSLGRKRLGEKDKLVYAPMSDVGGVLVDKDAVYIDVPEMTPGDGIGDRLLEELKNSKIGLGERTSGIQLFTGATVSNEFDDNDTGRKTLRASNAAVVYVNEDISESSDDNNEIESEDEVDSNEGDGINLLEDAESQDEDAAFEDSDSELDLESNEGPTMKQFLPSRRHPNINKLIYDDALNSEQVMRLYLGIGEDDKVDEVENTDEFFKAKDEFVKEIRDSSLPRYDFEAVTVRWDNAEEFTILRNRCAATRFLSDGGDDENEDDDDADDDGPGDFENLEDSDNSQRGEAENYEDNASADKSDEHAEESHALSMEEERALNAKKKLDLKTQFEEEDEGSESEADGLDWHDKQKRNIQTQLDINRQQLEGVDDALRLRMEGYRPGTYVRIVVDKVAAEFIENFDPLYPVILGTLLKNEERFGFVQVRIKRHRWHKRILKTNDPLIFSLGWRRFQSIPIYSTSDNRVRNRMLKYTPEHMHCFGTFYGPLIAPNTGFCAVQSVAQSLTTGAFRIAATGTVLSVDESTEIVKKLKLTGVPYKIFKNTAFIKDMFNTALEVAKFEGASIKTVSGIRGQIKRALSKPDGHFRATFEDKILMSDIVFLRAWYPILPRKFYNPVTSLLLEEKAEWKGMRLTGEIRKAENLATPQDGNSKYRAIERHTRVFNPLKVPRQLQAALPYASKVREQKPQKKETYMQKRAVVLGGKEKEARDLMLKVMTLRKEKLRKRQDQKTKQRAEHLKKMAVADGQKKERQKAERKEHFQKEARKKRKFGE